MRWRTLRGVTSIDRPRVRAAGRRENRVEPCVVRDEQAVVDDAGAAGRLRRVALGRRVGVAPGDRRVGHRAAVGALRRADEA